MSAERTFEESNIGKARDITPAAREFAGTVAVWSTFYSHRPPREMIPELLKKGANMEQVGDVGAEAFNAWLEMSSRGTNVTEAAREIDRKPEDLPGLSSKV